MIVLVPKGVLHCGGTSRAGDLVGCAIDESEDVVQILGNLARNREVLRDGQLLPDRFVVLVETIGVPTDVTDHLGCVTRMHEVQRGVEHLAKLRIVASPLMLVIDKNARVSKRSLK